MYCGVPWKRENTTSDGCTRERTRTRTYHSFALARSAVLARPMNRGGHLPIREKPAPLHPGAPGLDDDSRIDEDIACADIAMEELGIRVNGGFFVSCRGDSQPQG